MMKYDGWAPVLWQSNSPTWSNHHGFERRRYLLQPGANNPLFPPPPSYSLPWDAVNFPSGKTPPIDCREDVVEDGLAWLGVKW